MSSLSAKAIAILSEATVDGNAVYLNSGEIDRKLYETIDEVFNRLHGKWNGKKRCHQFAYDSRAALAAIIESGEMPKKNLNAFFPTPREVAQEIAFADDLITNMDEKITPNEYVKRVLEPSAGQGALCDLISECYPNAKIDTVEYFNLNQAILKEKGHAPFCGDFMDFVPDEPTPYDRIVMNPPFSLEGDKFAYITHTMRAFEMLEPRLGELYAILPVSFISNSTAKEKAFLNFVLEHGEITRLPKESFKESGTKIDTVLVHLSKHHWKPREYNGYKSFYSFDFYLGYSSDAKTWESIDKMLATFARAKSFNKETAKLRVSVTVKTMNAEADTPYLPLERMDEYVEVLERVYGMDYMPEDETDEDDIVSDPAAVQAVPAGSKERGAETSLSIKEKKKRTPTLFEFAA